MASQGEVPRRLGGNPSSEVTVQSQNKAKHTASQEGFSGKLLGNPNSEALAYNQDKASEAEGTAPMLREYSLPTPSKVGFFDKSKAVIIRTPLYPLNEFTMTFTSSQKLGAPFSKSRWRFGCKKLIEWDRNIAIT